MAGTLGGIVVSMLAFVFCICRSCLSRMVCSSISFWRRFLEICFAELHLLSMVCPLFNRGERRVGVAGRLVCFRVGREGMVID